MVMRLATIVTLLLAQPVFAQTGKSDLITLAEAEAMTPQQIAARFLSDEIDPAQAATASVGAALHSLSTIMVHEQPLAWSDDPALCRRTRYAMNFRPVDASPAGYRRGSAVRWSRTDVIFHYADKPADGECADPELGYFFMGGEPSATFAVLSRVRAAIAASRDGGDIGFDLTCDLARRANEDVCANPNGAFAGLAAQTLLRIEPSESWGRPNACGRNVTDQSCYEIEMVSSQPGAPWTWFATVDLASARPTIHIRVASVVRH
jgi:hypothetical protein